MTSAQGGRLSRLSNRTKRLSGSADETMLRWQDTAARSTRSRYLDPLQAGASDLGLALSLQAEAADAARSMAKLMGEQSGLCSTHLDRATLELQDGQEQMRIASQHVDSAHVFVGEFEQSLGKALDLLGQAGGQCGQATGADALRSQIDQRLAADQKRAAQLAVAREALIQAVPIAVGQAVEKMIGADLTNVDDLVSQVIDTARDPGMRLRAADEISSAVASVRGRFFGG